MSDTPRTDAESREFPAMVDRKGKGHWCVRIEFSQKLERELADAIAILESETRWADKYAAESHRLEMICQDAHDRLLRGDSDKDVMAILEEAWKGRSVSVDERRARTSNPTVDPRPTGKGEKE